MSDIERDAARYRWLRDNMSLQPTDPWGDYVWMCDNLDEEIADIDDAVDFAMGVIEKPSVDNGKKVRSEPLPDHLREYLRSKINETVQNARMLQAMKERGLIHRGNRDFEWRVK